MPRTSKTTKPSTEKKKTSNSPVKRKEKKVPDSSLKERNSRAIIAAAEVLLQVDYVREAARLLVFSPFAECHRYFFEVIIPYHGDSPMGSNFRPAGSLKHCRTNVLAQAIHTPEHALVNLRAFLNPDGSWISDLLRVTDPVTGDTPAHHIIRKGLFHPAAVAVLHSAAQSYAQFSLSDTGDKDGLCVVDLLRKLYDQQDPYRRKVTEIFHTYPQNKHVFS